jgi:transposase
MEASQFPFKKIQESNKPRKGDGDHLLRHAQSFLVDFTPHGATINASHYQSTLTGLKEVVYCKRPGLLSQGILLLHSNAQPHISCTTVNLLKTWHWEILPHPPCSPDLAPSDFHLFPKLKKHLQSLQYSSFYHQGFDCLIYCCDKCLNRYGDCIRKIDCVCVCYLTHVMLTVTCSYTK